MNLVFSAELLKLLSDNDIGIQRVNKILRAYKVHPEWRASARKIIHQMLKMMIIVKASDMDLGGLRANGKIWFRIFGFKKPSKEIPVFSTDETNAMLLSLLHEEQQEKLMNNKSIDFAIELLVDGRRLRFRSNICFERDSLAGNFRHIKHRLFTIPELDISEPVTRRLNLEYEKSGLILVTGITGSGKSATLDAIIDFNNKTNQGHIIVIGNPIEYVHKSQNSLVTHREIGTDALHFQSATIESLRQDPDVIVVGEMRDRETISAVLEVTDSGHKVFSTLHTSSTVESIHRIIAQYPPQEQERVRHRLADVLKVVISQKLVPTVDGKVILAKEILSVDYSVQSAIRNNNLSEIFQMITEGKTKGMYTMQQNLQHLVLERKITPETAMNYCNNRRIMRQLLTQHI